jgi:hypothetical protein
MHSFLRVYDTFPDCQTAVIKDFIALGKKYATATAF